jgi:hypothetical protein
MCSLVSAAQTSPQSSSSSAKSSTNSAAGVSSSADKKHVKGAPDSDIDAGAVTDGVYRNKTLGLTWKIPEGWVLRTEEMNEGANRELQQGAGKVLLAAFSRPPAAQGEDVNASILIAAERASAYPGLKEPVQYLAVLEEFPKSQGFTADVEPYEIAVGPKTLVREDFHKDVGSRVMRQSTMAMLAHGYAVSITVIGGTEDEIEDLLDGLEFAPAKTPAK